MGREREQERSNAPELGELPASVVFFHQIIDQLLLRAHINNSKLEYRTEYANGKAKPPNPMP